MLKDEFGKSEDKRLHLDLLPTPYWGHLETASVFLLMLNPGLKPSAFYLEETVAEVKSAKLETLRQENASDEYPFLPLNPAFSYLPVADYWRKKFKSLLTALQEDEKQQRTYQQAAQLLAKKVACLQLVPYHSKDYGLPRRLFNELKSKDAAVEYVKNVLLKKAENNEATIVAMRGAKEWGFIASQEQPKNVFVYQGNEARAAHLILEKDAGKAVLKRIREAK